jgi:hypothetical protein
MNKPYQTMYLLIALGVTTSLLERHPHDTIEQAFTSSFMGLTWPVWFARAITNLLGL